MTDFTAWLDSPIVEVELTRRDWQWFAIADDFGIAGIGATEDGACRDVAHLVDAYLRSCHAKGLSYRQARRPLREPSLLSRLFRRFGRRRRLRYMMSSGPPV